jgi:hypothetical protein
LTSGTCWGAVDHFCAADGKPINMVWLRKGTTAMNIVVEMFASRLLPAVAHATTEEHIAVCRRSAADRRRMHDT